MRGEGLAYTKTMKDLPDSMQDLPDAAKASPLGKVADYPRVYSPGVLCPIARRDSRASLGLGETLPFDGADLWTAWELTWLTRAGTPRVAAADILVPAGSPNIVESKSLKLYLNSFAMSSAPTGCDIAAVIRDDLSAAAGAPVDVALRQSAAIEKLPGDSLDEQDIVCSVYDVDAGLLEADDAVAASECLHSRLLRSLCPVTGQPDFGSLVIRYEGPRIARDGLLRYIVSFREHNDFHETCVERMFVDLKQRCRPERLSVYARYQRRGGIDINPFRSDFETAPANARLWNQ